MEGYDYRHAVGLATFEARINEWPLEWGNDFIALIFGDFDPPDKDLEFEALNIIIESKPLRNTPIRGALTVLRARAYVSNKSVAAVKDAVKRLNLLIGLLSFTNQGAPIRLWSYLIRPTGSGVKYKFQIDTPLRLLSLIQPLPEEARKRVIAAMYWIREPRGMILETNRTAQFAIYGGYWNAFECLVEAANLIIPQDKLDRGMKKTLIKEKLALVGDEVGPGDIEKIYQEVVNPRLRPKAEHAIKLCTGDASADFIRECFEVEPKGYQLYRLRNAINHGTLDIDDPETLILIESRFPKLSELVFTMLNGVLALNLKS